MAMIYLHSLLLCIFTFYAADGAVDIRANPSKVEIGLTRSLVINCTFSDDNATTANLISLILTSTNDMQFPFKYEEVATIDAFNGLHVKQVSGDNSTVFGDITFGGEAYLGVTFLDPTLIQTGFYRCDANVMDQTGHPAVLSDSADVTALKVDTALLLNKVRDMETQLLDLTNKLATLDTLLNQRIDGVKNDLQALSGNSTSHNATAS